MSAMVKHKGFWCEKVQDGVTVRVQEFDNGQRETLIQPRYLYIPGTSDPDDPDCHVVEVDQTGTLEEQRMLEERAKRSAWKSGQRAKRNCRWKIKQGGFNEMLTLTYRANQQDLALCRKHFAAWLRKMRKALPCFRGVWGFERQERGAWHVHVACDRLPMLIQLRGCKVLSWKVGTALWRDVVGVNNGLCFVGGKDGRFNRYRSPAKIAGYVSKYLTKEHENGETGARMWDSSRGLTPPAASIMHFPGTTMAEAISLAWELPEGHSVVQHICNKLNTVWLLYSEPDPLRRAANDAAMRRAA
jgi:hypothetical protein